MAGILVDWESLCFLFKRFFDNKGIITPLVNSNIKTHVAMHYIVRSNRNHKRGLLTFQRLLGLAWLTGVTTSEMEVSGWSALEDKYLGVNIGHGGY